MKSPMQELIEYIEEFTPKNKTTDGIWSKAKSLIKQEKELIIESFNQGMNNSVEYFLPNNKISESEQYYNETFVDNPEAGI